MGHPVRCFLSIACEQRLQWVKMFSFVIVLTKQVADLRNLLTLSCCSDVHPLPIDGITQPDSGPVLLRC